MQRNTLSVLLLTALFVLFSLFSPDPVSASRGMECQETQAQTHAAARLKRGQFVRVLMASGREFKGHFRSFDGLHLVLEIKRDYDVITLASGEIVRIKKGRGFLGSLRHGLSESGRKLAKPVTYWIDGYRMMDALGDLMG
jgi:hypothetical protein